MTNRQGTKSQFYRYSMKCDAYLNATMCTRRIYAYPVPPENALGIQNLFVHFRIQFDSGVASADRKIEQIGIANDRPALSTVEPTNKKMLDLNVSADANRRIDLRVDLSDLLVREKVDYDSQFEADYTDGEKTLVYLKFPEGLLENNNVGTIEIWKIDSIWTTEKIR